MFLPTLLSLLLVLHMRRTLRFFSPDPALDKRLKQCLYAIIFLILISNISYIGAIAKWISYALFFLIVTAVFKKAEFYRVRPVIFAVLPLAIVSLVSHLMIAINRNLFWGVETFKDYAFPVAVTWLVAMLIIWFRQEKVAKREHKRRVAEEEEARVMAARKEELEIMVAERIAELKQQKEELQLALTHLEATQTQLIQKEKMASLGELTAGIAHEIQNPLNFVNNFSDVNAELLDELMKSLQADDKAEALLIANHIRQNEQKITYHGRRADDIVKAMLQHSRTSSGEKEPTDINALADEYLRLSYHGLRAKDRSFNARFKIKLDESLEKINVVPQDIGRVLLNLFNNAFYSVNQKSKALNGSFTPEVIVRTKRLGNGVAIIVKDNGNGIPAKVVDKIFQPFFTTKPTGDGTGLGLSLSYDIITKGHAGSVTVNTIEGEYAEFIIELPIPEAPKK